jgi:hypothetical protein
MTGRREDFGPEWMLVGQGLLASKCLVAGDPVDCDIITHDGPAP